MSERVPTEPGATSAQISGQGFGGSTAGSTSIERISPDFLVVILDLNAYAWQSVSADGENAAERADGAFAKLQQVISSVLVFLNAYTAMQHGNGLVVYGAATGTARLLYSSSPNAHIQAHEPTSTLDTRESANLPFKHMNDAVFHGMRSLFESEEAAKHGPVGIVRALALALCHIHRVSTTLHDHAVAGAAAAATGHAPGAHAGTTSFQHRILVLSATPDVSAQYVPMMNCIFSAQKQGIQVDVCRVLGNETVFLRQACHLTGGHYCHVPRIEGLLQVLMTTFLPSRSIQDALMFPALDDVDFRAACFCHRRNVDIGYVCSVCLSSTLTLLTPSFLRATRIVPYLPCFVPSDNAASFARRSSDCAAAALGCVVAGMFSHL